MSATNTATSFGQVARSLHWLTALLILSAIGLGLYAEGLPHDSSEALAAKAEVFSIHKTIGMAAFLVALVRIVWALTQPKPAPIHPDRKAETLLAELIHWSLYIAMLVMPLSGWVHHAAVEGFAPILWPFGQDLPFVPKSETVAQTASLIHLLSSKLLIGSILLHVLGALKHAVVDRDGTLARMVTGRSVGRPGPHPVAPALIAIAIYAAGASVALTLAPGAPEEATAPAQNAAPSASSAGNWQVQTGTLGFTVRQMGADVGGSFANWQADIQFDEQPTNGSHGKVKVTIDTTSLSLGSVTEQAKGADFFDTANHATAVFEADILPAASGYEAKGTLSLRGQTQPASLPFTLAIDGDTATMTGSTTLDRRAFGIGSSYGDEATVGFNVGVTVELTAKRAQ